MSHLHDVSLAAGGMDAHAKACQVPVPEHGILLADGERIDSTLGDTSLASSRHGGSPEGHSRGRRVLEVCNQTAYDGHQIEAYWNAELTAMQGLPGGTIKNYFNISSRLANHGVLGTSAAYVESSDILFSPVLYCAGSEIANDLQREPAAGARPTVKSLPPPAGGDEAPPAGRPARPASSLRELERNAG